MKDFFDKLVGGCIVIGIIGFWLMWFLLTILYTTPPAP
jgi:hypothetical protein